MNSSGIKRGLAATAIAALAVTGVPVVASAATLATQETAASSAVGVNLRSIETGGVASVAGDGTNSTISLVATGGTGVEFVSFFRGATLIATVGRSANGDFQYEWTPPVGVATADISAVRTDAAGNPPVAPAPVNTPASTDTATGVTISGTAPTVEIAPKNSLGYFAQPVGAVGTDYVGANSGNNVAGISGTTSQSTGVLTVDAESVGVVAGPSPINVGTLAAGQNSQSFNGTVSVTAAAIAGDNDQILPVLETAANTRDAQGFNVYAQTISGLTATAAPVLPDSTTTTVTVTVNDQNGQPVAGAKVEADNGNGGVPSNGGFTNGLGQVTFTGAAAGTQSYYVETTNQDGFTTGVDFRTSVTTQTSRPTNIAVSSQDGNAFDIDEYEANDVRVRVTDAAGNPLPGQRFFYTLGYAPFVPSGTNQAQTFNGPATGVTTDAQGFATVTIPTTGTNADQLGNGGTGGTFTLNGYVNRDGSNPGQDPVDLALAATQFKIGESTVDFAGPATTDRQSGTAQVFTGSVALRDGTTLAGRTLDITYAPTANSALSATQPAGATRLSNTAATVVTGQDGTFSVSVTDPSATPQVDELGNTLTARGTANVGTAPNVRNGIGADATDTVTVNFRADAAPTNILLTQDSDTTLGENDPFEELVDNQATPGRPVSFQVRLVNSAGSPLAGQQVTLKTSNGFFTSNVGAPGNNAPGGLTAAPAPAEGGAAGTYRNLTDTLVVTTDASGFATATVAIERDAGFDDDGQVTANITATSGTATNTTPIAITFTSANALNPGEVTVEAAENQQAGVELPEARVGQQVRLDVFATDQFGNLTADQVVLSDNTADAGFLGQAANGTLTVTSQFTSSGPAAIAVAQDDTTQTVTATWNQATNTFTDANAATPGFQPSVATNNTNVETDTAEPIEWYQIDFATSTFTLTSDPEGDVPIGTAVTETVRVIDQNGNPVQGLAVQFIRQGPAGQDGDPNIPTQFTNANGEAFYSFTGTEAGIARVSAVVSDGEQNKTVVDTVRFTATAAVDPEARISGRHVNATDTVAGYDLITVRAAKADAEAVVKLFRVKNGVAKRVKQKVIGADGVAKFKRADLNGTKGTKYYAVVTKTATNLKGRTGTITVK